MLKPEFQEREARPYVAIHERMPREELGSIAPQLVQEVSSWLESHGASAQGKPFIRYLTVDSNDATVEIEVGIPARPHPSAADDRVRRGVLPAGMYVVVTHRGGYALLVDTTAALLDWGKEHGVKWRVTEKDQVTRWACRVEHYLVGGDSEPEMSRWRTEIAILVASAPV